MPNTQAVQTNHEYRNIPIATLVELKESEAGVETGELCRRHGITRACYYRWKSKFGGMEVSEAKRLRQLEEENRQLKHIVAEQAVDIRGLKAVVTKKW